MNILKRKFSLASLIILSTPAILIYVYFLIYPLMQSVVFSFYYWNGLAGVAKEFIGLENYITIFSAPKFWNSMLNALWFLLGGFVVLMPISFVLAIIITSKLKGVRFFRSAFFMPYILPITATSLIWIFLLYPDGGLVNNLLEFVNISSINWLGDPNIAIYTVVLVGEWISAGFYMLIFSAGMMAIPNDLYEAARIDGVNEFQRITRIMIPNLSETFRTFSILCITSSLRTFTLVWVMTGGGPNNATQVPATLLYTEAFQSRNFGSANAISTVLLFLALFLSFGVTKLISLFAGED